MNGDELQAVWLDRTATAEEARNFLEKVEQEHWPGMEGTRAAVIIVLDRCVSALEA